MARLEETYDQTGEPDWSLVLSDFEIHDHELPDSEVHCGERLARMDYYPTYRARSQPGPGPGAR